MKSPIEVMANDFIKKAESQGWFGTEVHNDWGSNYSMVFLEKKTKNEKVTIGILTDIQFTFGRFAHIVIEKEESRRVYKDKKYFKKYEKEVEKLFKNS